MRGKHQKPETLLCPSFFRRLFIIFRSLLLSFSHAFCFIMLMCVEAGHASVCAFGRDLKGGWTDSRMALEGLPSARDAEGQPVGVVPVPMQAQIHSSPGAGSSVLQPAHVPGEAGHSLGGGRGNWLPVPKSICVGR